MSNRTEIFVPHAGLGLIIVKISFALAMHRPVQIRLPNSDNVAYDIKRIFKISDDRLEIVCDPTSQRELDIIDSDELGTYAPYFESDVIQLFGQDFSTARKKKKCVALAVHHGSGLGEDTTVRSMPLNKYATSKQYQEIFLKLTQDGYDVLSMNHVGLRLEDKAYMLNQLCDFVIGYEGGLGHLAHLLKIPYIVLPWRLNDSGDPLQLPNGWFETHRFHADRRTWFVDSVEEFLTWSTQQLQHRVEDLYNLGGNNILFRPTVMFDPDTLEIASSKKTQLGYMDLTPRIGPNAKQFIKEHLPIENMVKYPVKSMTYNT